MKKNCASSWLFTKQYVLHILVRVYSLKSSSKQSACAVTYCHLWPVWLHNIFSQYLKEATIFGEKKIIDHKMCFLILSKFFVQHFSF
jgi:hypothetical protein